MKLALLKGNRFNPWHLRGFELLRDKGVETTAFRAESEIQNYFSDRSDDKFQFGVERIFFDTQAGNPFQRLVNILNARYRDKSPRILPFYERLKNFDIIQTWELFTDWTEQALEARKRYGVPVSVMVWDNIPFNNESLPEQREIKARAIQEADRFLVYTERSRRTLLIEGAPADKISVLNPGVDTRLFCPGEKDRSSLDVADDEFLVLFVGWFLPRKGLDFLLLAMRELLNDHEMAGRRIRLLHVGSGPGKDRIEELVKRLELKDYCTFAGSVPYEKMPGIYRAADVFVLPSVATPAWQEQFGMSLIEAMACGVPVISTLSGAIPEVAGDAGILCQPNDFMALKHALKGIIMDSGRCEQLSTAARGRVLSNYSIDDHVNSLNEIYRGMAANK